MKKEAFDSANMDKTKMVDQVLSVIAERLNDVEEIQSWCIVIEEATLI